MEDLTDLIARDVRKKLTVLGCNSPKLPVLRLLLRTAYLASLKTEEGRFVRGSVTFADPKSPYLSPPPRRRADYPKFTVLKHRHPFNVELLVKLARAIDKWSGSIAVFGTTTGTLRAWGVVDQMVHQNTLLNREGSSGFRNPGVLSISIDGIGDLSIYHGGIFLSAMREHNIVTDENAALEDRAVFEKIAPALIIPAARIAEAIECPAEYDRMSSSLFEAWQHTVARICIGLRRAGTGGSFIITPTPRNQLLDVSYRFPYNRLGDSLILSVLDSEYAHKSYQKRQEEIRSGVVSGEIVVEEHLADTDLEDRTDEVTGAVKIVTSLACIDGAVLLDPVLRVVGFGVKIGSSPPATMVFDGSDFVQKGIRAKRIDTSRFGTRHNSMLRYCLSDSNAIGIVVSQDGQVRLIVSSGRHLLLWENVKLLRYHNYSRKAAHGERKRRLKRKRLNMKTSFGYTRTPKTIAALLKTTKSRPRIRGHKAKAPN